MNITEFNIELSKSLGISLFDYVFLLMSTTLWIIFIYLPSFACLEARLFCFVLRKYFPMINAYRFRVFSINLSFNMFSISLRNLSLFIEEVGYFEIEEMRITLNHPTLWKNKGSSMSKRNFCVKCFGFSLHLFQESFVADFRDSENHRDPRLIRLLHSIFQDSFFDVQNVLVFYSSLKEENLMLVIEMERFVFAYGEFSVFSDNDTTYTLKSHAIVNSRKIKSIIVHLFDLNVNIVKHEWKKKSRLGLFRLTRKTLENSLKLLYLKESTFQMNFGELPDNYLYQTGKQFYFKPSAIIDATSFSDIEINLHLRHELNNGLIDLFRTLSRLVPKDSNYLSRLYLKQISIHLAKSNEIIFNLNLPNKTEDFSTFELKWESSSGMELNFDTNNLSFSSCLNEQRLLQINPLNVYFSSRKSLKKLLITSCSGQCEVFLKNIMPILRLLSLELSQISSLFDIVLEVNSCFLRLPCILNDLENGCLTVSATNVYAHLKHLKPTRTSLLVLKNIELFNFSQRAQFKAKSERVVLESLSTHDDQKMQILFAPIIFGREAQSFADEGSCSANVSMHSFQSYLYTYNVSENLSSSMNLKTLFEAKNMNDCVLNKAEKLFTTTNNMYLATLQFRYEQFKFENKSYSHQFELVFGDFFGSIDIPTLVEMIDLACSIGNYYQCEKDAYLFISENCIAKHLQAYVSVRCMTSLIQFNILDNIERSMDKFVLFNLTLSPANYAFCDFHFADDKSGKLGSMPDIHLRVFCSVASELGETNSLHLIECGSVVSSFLSLHQVDETSVESQQTKIELLKRSDEETKRLDFVWDANNKECACCGNAKFFSDLNSMHKMYQFDKESIVKPCVYVISPTLNKYGFGQSLLVPNEMAFFSYRNFVEPKLNSKIFAGQTFTVLANLESDEALLKQKFDPFQIVVYENELEKFNNESLSFNFLNKLDPKHLDYNSANMTPPYFSKEFNVYIRYL